MSEQTEQKTKKTEDIVPVTRHAIETIMSVALVVPIKGTPGANNCVWGLPTLFWGPPGIGKSDRIEESAARLGLPSDVLFPSTNQPEDVAGVIIPDGQGGGRKVCLLDPVNKLAAAGKGVLFIDELTGARPATQGAYLGAILKRQFGDVAMPPAVRLASAANPPEEAAGGWDLEPPMANRFAHFRVPVPTPEDWTNWLLSEDNPRDTSIKDYEELVAQNWGAAWAKARGLFAAFIRKNGKLLHNMPPEGSAQRGRAWPSPRTWAFASRAVATCMALRSVLADPDDLMLDFVTACVGSGAAGEFGTWLREANLPNPEDVLANGWAPDKLRIDRNYAVYASMTAFVLQAKDEAQRLKYATQAFGVLEVASDAGMKDVITPSVAALVNRGLTASLASSTDPAKKGVGQAASKLMAKLGKTKIATMLRGV